MKTKDLIKLLQEEDPGGESHVRIGGGALVGVEIKPGYWDGHYDYIDEDGTYVTSTKGNKVDLTVMDITDFIWHYDGDINEIKKKVRVDYGYTYTEKENIFWQKVEDEAKKAKEISLKLNKEWLNKTIKKYKEGWNIVQLKKTLFWKKGLIKNNLCGGEIEAVLESGLFQPIEKKKYIQYKLK